MLFGMKVTYKEIEDILEKINFELIYKLCSYLHVYMKIADINFILPSFATANTDDFRAKTIFLI